MSRRGRSSMGSVAAGVTLAAAAWWVIRRVWLAKEATEAEPPAVTASGRPGPLRPPATARPDPVDEAIAESFPASDPPSFAGARGHGDAGG